MSYLRKYEYIILPDGSYTIIRHCPICGIKSLYINSNNFRVNANGNRIDVWLIYQCEKCKHTYNLSIVERMRKDDLSLQHYKGFMENDKVLALKYGLDKSIFFKSKATIDINSLRYRIISKYSHGAVKDEQIIYLIGDSIEIDNPYNLKIRADKIVSEALHISRKKAKQLIKSGIITFNDYPRQNLEILIIGDIYNEPSH